MPEPGLSLSFLTLDYNCVFLQLNNKFAHQMPRLRMWGEGGEGEAGTVTTLSCTKKVKIEPNFWPEHCGLLSPRALEDPWAGEGAK